MNYEKLFDLAERAKTYRILEIANIIFVFLLGESLAGRGNFHGYMLQSRDRHHSNPADAYYDLIYIRNAHVAPTLNLGVPITLLNPIAWANLIKGSVYAERVKGEERKDFQYATREIQRQLWNELFENVNFGRLAAHVQTFVNHVEERGRLDQKKHLLGTLEAWKSTLGK